LVIQIHTWLDSGCRGGFPKSLQDQINDVQEYVFAIEEHADGAVEATTEPAAAAAGATEDLPMANMAISPRAAVSPGPGSGTKRTRDEQAANEDEGEQEEEGEAMDEGV
jgi:hypothetical protein